MAVDPNLQTVEIKRFQCRHIFTDGHRCGSPSLRGENFCYFHHSTRKVVSDPYHRALRRNGLQLPMPEDRAALILAIGEILQGVATKAITTKEAGVMLYGLQIANAALARESFDGVPARANSRTQPRRSTLERPAPGDLEKLAPLEDIVSDDHLGTIAPAAEYLEPEEKEERKSLARQLLDEVEEYEDRQYELQQERVIRDQIETAVRFAREEAREKAFAEAYIDIQEVAQAARATAIAETEARLRAELTPTPETLPKIQAVADPQTPPLFTSTRHSRIRHPQTVCHSRRESAGCPTHGSPLAMGGFNHHLINSHPSPFCHSRRKSAFALCICRHPERSEGPRAIQHHPCLSNLLATESSIRC